MVGFVLRRRFARPALSQAATILLLYSAPHFAPAGCITYDLIDYQVDLNGQQQQNGWTISGTITTDGALGDLHIDDILAWSWSATPPTGPPAISESWSHSDGFYTGLLFEVDGLFATAQSLSIPGDGDGLKIGDNNGSGDVFLSWLNVNGDRDIVYQGKMGAEDGFGWYTRPSNAIWQNDYQIATLAPGSNGAVPEPSSIIIWSGLATVAVFLRFHRRMHWMPG